MSRDAPHGVPRQGTRATGHPVHDVEWIEVLYASLQALHGLVHKVAHAVPQAADQAHGIPEEGQGADQGRDIVPQRSDVVGGQVGPQLLRRRYVVLQRHTGELEGGVIAPEQGVDQNTLEDATDDCHSGPVGASHLDSKHSRAISQKQITLPHGRVDCSCIISLESGLGRC